MQNHFKFSIKSQFEVAIESSHNPKKRNALKEDKKIKKILRKLMLPSSHGGVQSKCN